MRFTTLKILVFLIGTIVSAQQKSPSLLNNKALHPYETLIRDWLKCYDISVDKFDFVSTNSLTLSESVFNPQNTYMRIYFPYCRISPDRHQCIDVSSYHYLFKKDSLGRTISEGMQVDSAVKLFIPPEKKQFRLLFAGSQTRFDDAFWLDNQHLIVVGGEYLYRFVPEIWLIDLNLNKIDFYMYITVLPRYPKCNYKKIKYPDVIFPD